MLLKKSIEMMKQSFEQTKYDFKIIPQKSTANRFGIYINVPFCKTKCNFCPFYKETFDELLKDEYLKALIQEIEETDIKGSPTWIYFGGGTPNLLTVEELFSIISALKKKVKLENMGIELLPTLASKEFISILKEIGFSKISFGIESLSPKINEDSNRVAETYEKINSFIKHAKSKGLWVNVDLIIGMKNQTPEMFLEDIELLTIFNPDQITTYPYMTLRGHQDISTADDKVKFETIENAAYILKSKGYKRDSIWCFAKSDNVYDSCKDELIDDYIGFGPAAFSTFNNFKVVNPNVKVYINNFKTNNAKYGFISLKTKASDEWRKFAKMIYTLNCKTNKSFPWFINLYIILLKLNGIKRKNGLSKKGTTFAHSITKTVVESLPFPIQNKACIENNKDYSEHLKHIENQISKDVKKAV